MRISSFGLPAIVVTCVIAVSVWWVQLNPAPVDKMRIAALSLPGAGLFFVAEQKGFFREQGLDVTLLKHDLGQHTLDSLFKGDADVAIAGDTPLVFAILGGRKPDILSTVYRPNGGISIIALKDRVPGPSDLRGKRLGVSFNSSGQFVADTFLLLHGIPQAEVTLVDLKQHEMIEKLLTGEIDAACLWQPYLTEAQARLGDKDITFPNDGLYTFRLSLVANRGYAALQPEKVRKLLAALKMAQAYIAGNPDDSLRIMGEATAIAASTYKTFFESADYGLGLEQGLLLAFEDQTRWAIKRGLVHAEKMPNYLDLIQADGLMAVSPELVKIIR